MKKSFALQIRATDSRNVTKMSSDWSDVCLIDLPTTKHMWGYITDTDEIKTYEAFNDDMISFTDEIMNELTAALLHYHINVVFDLDYAPTIKDLYQIRNGWYNNTDKHTYTMVNGNTEQMERLERKNGSARFVTRAKVMEHDGHQYIAETSANGSVKQRTHTFLDLFAILKPQIESCINAALRARKAGHVMIRLTRATSVTVTGSAN